MKLSEAIRLGGVLSAEQLRGEWAYWYSDGTISTCALGGAVLALCPVSRWRDPSDWEGALLQKWPWVTNDVLLQVVLMNDKLGASREDIARYIESLEAECPENQSATASDPKAPVAATGSITSGENGIGVYTEAA